MIAGISIESSPSEPVRAGTFGAGAAVVVAAGADGAGGAVVAGAGAGGGDVAAGGGDATGLLTGLTSQALSSNPSVCFSEADADELLAAGCLTVLSVFCSKAFGSTTSLV